MPSGPASAFIFNASSSRVGWRYRKDGNLSMHVSDGLAVSSLPGGRYPHRLRPRDFREGIGTISRELAFLLPLQSFEHFLRRDRHLVDPHSDRIVDRVGNS